MPKVQAPDAYRSERARSDVAIRPLLAEDATAVLRAILAAGDYGVLLTDLDHRSLACNRKFGEMFDLDPEDVVRFEVQALRKRVRHLIPDPVAWVARLNEIYEEPTRSYEDDLTLLKEAPITVRRFCGPVVNDRREIIGRLWTFRDVTRERRREKMESVLHTISSFHDPDPRKVYRRILSEISEFYDGSTSILSIQKGRCMDFREVIGGRGALARVKENRLLFSYCKFTLRESRALAIQDTRRVPEFRRLPQAWVGYSRYVGAPIYDPAGKAIGTICFLDGHSERLVDEEDARFMSLLAMRVSAELAREQFIQQRVSEQQEVVDQQSRDLQATQDVLSAMNDAFHLLSGNRATDALLAEQALLLKGVLGYGAAALLTPQQGGTKLAGFVATGGRRQAKPVCVAVDSIPGLARRIDDSRRSGTHDVWVEETRATAIGTALGTPFAALAVLVHAGEFRALLALGDSSAQRLANRHHSTHLEALVEQVGLVLGAHGLNLRLQETHEELRAMHRKLIETEKLSVAGPLAAATAHDIRNILSSLKMAVEFGAEGPEEALASVREQLDRFAVLAHRLLSYAKPRLIATQPVDVGRCIERVIALTSAHTRIAKVALEYRSAGKLRPIDADPHQIEHLLVNLILNALEAMEPGGGKLSISTSRRRGYAVIEVTDTGKGIDPSVVDVLFLPFGSKRAEGFGLGLYSCKRIVEEYGGSISIRSSIGSGATIRLAFPEVAAEAV